MKTNINWKAILIVSFLMMGFVSSQQRDISAANTFSGFVDGDGTYSGFINLWSQWTVEQYTVQGKRTLNTPWMSKHKVIDNIGTYGQNKILYRYGEYLNTLLIGNKRYVSLSLSMYGYHGGSITVKPVQTNQYPSDFNIFINDKLYDTVHAEAGSDHKIDLNLQY